LLAVKQSVADEEVFLAKYTDGLTDLALTQYLAYARQREQDCYISKREAESELPYRSGRQRRPRHQHQGGDAVRHPHQRRIFVLKGDIFKYMRPGEELVVEPFHRLIEHRQLAAYEYDGFFAAIDTFKDKQQLDDLNEGGQPPWEVWRGKNGNSECAAPNGIERLGNKPGRVPLSDRHG
jgi:glucose-1-phosphate cytidylyltransferase